MKNFLFEQVLENISDFEEKSTKIFIDSTRQDLADFLHKKNFIFADRTIQVTSPLKNDFKKFCRLSLEISEKNNRIQEIAKKSFVNDVRFISKMPPIFDEEIFEKYFAEMEKCFICRVKDEIAGFIEVTEEGIIRLAAVDEKFRLSGAALSLYAGAAEIFRQKNFKKLVGRISAKNMPVMNLYATLGANFSRPQDVYLISS